MKLLTLLPVMVIGLVSCNDPSDDTLYGEWRLEKYNCTATSSYGLSRANQQSNYVLHLDKSGVFSFTTDCNAISGNFRTDKTALDFSNISFTEKACGDMLVEVSIKSNLPCIKTYEIRDDSFLILKDADGHILMELTK